MDLKKGRPKKIHISASQPTPICYECGMKYGSFKCGTATWTRTTCQCCGKLTSCTEPRDFGYFLAGWKQKKEGKEIILGTEPD